MDKALFLDHIAQTTPFPIGLEVEKANGSYIYDKNGKAYLDMISGVAVSNLGHNHPKIVEAIKKQVDQYLHVMVYGEFIQEPQNALAQALKSILPENLHNFYFVNSGAEAVEAALKLAKRSTGKTELIACKKAYHGSTHGALSVGGNETKKQAYRPLLPDVKFITHNSLTDLEKITVRTAAVLIEVIQGDAGVRIPSKQWLTALRNKCNETGTLLIFDEIQTGFGRTGKFFAFEHFEVVPDILVLGKALGGGMPIGAVVSSKKRMANFTFNPMLGHITTFGGHPVPCAAGAAFVSALKSEISWQDVEEKGQYLENALKHTIVKEIRRKGLMFAIDLANFTQVKSVFDYCLAQGVITFWFLSTDYSFRLSPPLNISYQELDQAIEIIQEGFDLAKS